MDELNSLNKLNSLNSLNTLGGRGSGSQQDVGIEELLYLAQAKGGRIAEVANELSGTGTRSILSTIGNKFKTTFNDFVDVISIPGQVVAGVISKDFTVEEVIKENKRVSDVIFGDTNIFGKDGTPTTMQKVGDFIVRLPVDILTDPLTYLTFGASSTKGILGKMGFKSNVKVSLGKDGAEILGKSIDDGEVISRALSDYGQDVFSFQKKYSNALRNKTKDSGLLVKSAKKELIDSGVSKELLDAVQKNTKALMKETIDARFDVPMAQKVISNIMSKNPALVETMIDKGGIKFMGKTILDAQRIGKISSVIPGMKWIDEVSMPLRNSILAKFDTGLVKVGSDYVRLPEHVVNMRQQLKNVGEKMNVDLLKNLDDVQRVANLNESEIDILVNSISNKVPPADMRLQGAYYKLLGIKENGLGILRKSGIPVSLMDNHVGLISVPNDSRFIRGNSAFGSKVGSQQRASYIAAIPLQEVGAVQQMDEVKKVLEGLGGNNELKDTLTKISDTTKVRTVEDVTTILGEKRDSIIKELTKDGKMSLENAVKDSRVVKLDELQSLTKDLKTEGRLVGKDINLGLTIKNTDEEIRAIISEADTKISKLNISKKNFEDDIAEMSSKISEAMKQKVLGNFDSFMKTLPPESRTNAKVIMQRIEEYVGKADIEKLKANVLESKTKQQLAKEVVGVSYDDALDIASKILKDEAMMPVDVENLNKFIKETLQEKLNKVTREGGKKELKTISDIDKNKIAKLYEESGAQKYKIVREKMDENALSKLIEVLKDEYTKDPAVLRTFVSSLIGKESKLNDVISLIDETRLNAQKKIGLLPDEEMYFVDNADKVYKRVATTAQELSASGIEGFDKNLLTAFTTREMQNIRQALGHEFAQGLVRNFGRWADEAPDSWVTMSSSLVNDEAKAIAQGFVRGDGTEMKFHPAIAKMFDEMVTGMGGGDEVTKGFLKSYDKLQSYYKSYLTTVFPMFHGRNAISNVLLNFLDMGFSVFDPRKHFTAINLIKDDRQINKLMRIASGTGDEAAKASQELTVLMNKDVFTDVTGYKWKLGELRDVIRKNDIAFNPNITGSLDVRNDYKGLSDFYMTGKTNKEIAKARLNPLNADQFAPTRFGRDVLGRTIEEQSRLVNFMKNLMDTGDVTHAAKRTKQFLFDYSNLTKFEKDIMKRIMPFYSFTRKNLELQARTLMTAPGKIASEIKVVNSLGSFINGEPMTEEERKLLPKWMQNNLNIKRRREDGKYEIVSGFGTPIEQPFQQFQAQSLLGSLSPIIKFPLEKMTGYNLFRGKMTSDVTDAKDFRDAPEAVKELIGYTEWEGTDKSGNKYTVYRSLRPEAMHTLMSMPYSRFISTMSSITDSDVSSELRLLQTVTGVTARPFEEEQLREEQARQMLKDLEKILRDSGLRGEFKRGYNRKDTTTIEN